MPPTHRTPARRGPRAGRDSVLAPPRIYGNETRFKASVGRHIARGQDLLDHATGVRKMIDAIPREPGRPRTLMEEVQGRLLEDNWTQDVGRWHRSVWTTLRRYLADAGPELLPTVTADWPSPSEKTRHTLDMDWMEPWLRDSVEELAGFRNALGISRNVAAVAPEPARFGELEASGLVDSKVIDGYARAMRSPRTPKQLADAIGAAKDLTEATLRAALTTFGGTPGRGDDLPTLMKDWRKRVADNAPPDPATTSTLDQAQAALANVVRFIAEWRNAYGTGHGRPRYPPGLKPRHARLAVDSAETAIRFIVTTMDDLERLPGA